MLSKKKIAFITIGSVLLIGLIGCFNHSAQDKADFISDRIAKKLELNEQQRSKLDDVKNAALQARSTMQQNRATHFEQVTALIQAEQLDKNAIYTLFDNKTVSLKNSADPVLDKLVIFHASLNDEQKTKVITFLNDHKEKHQNWSHH